jgi:hypothetical protein
MLSSALLYGGIAAMAASAAAAAVTVLVSKGKKRKLDAQLETEYGPKRS